MEKYQRGRKLGEGVYGQVYLAKRITDSAVVAIKRVKSQDPNGGIDRSILREIKYLTELSEANIINLYDVYVMDGNVHLVLEYCPYNLEDIIRDKSIYLESKHSKCLIYMLIQSVVQCHSNFILHRDLKPQNILFSDKTNVLKLTDFGLARAYGSPIQMTSTIVSLWYRAPELLMGKYIYMKICIYLFLYILYLF